MSYQKTIRIAIAILLFVLFLVGCGPSTPQPTPTPTLEPTPDMTPGEVKLVFVDKTSGEPVDTTPLLFHLSEDQSQAEKDAFEDNQIDIENDAPGEYLIKSVLPGSYAVMVFQGEYKTVSEVFTVEPGLTIDLGVIELEP